MKKVITFGNGFEVAVDIDEEAKVVEHNGLYYQIKEFQSKSGKTYHKLFVGPAADKIDTDLMIVKPKVFSGANGNYVSRYTLPVDNYTDSKGNTQRFEWSSIVLKTVVTELVKLMHLEPQAPKVKVGNKKKD